MALALPVQALVEEGKVKYIGLSEVGPEDLRRAHKVHPITAVQLEWSLFTRDVEVMLHTPCCRACLLNCCQVWSCCSSRQHYCRHEEEARQSQ